MHNDEAFTDNKVQAQEILDALDTSLGYRTTAERASLLLRKPNSGEAKNLRKMDEKRKAQQEVLASFLDGGVVDTIVELVLKNPNVDPIEYKKYAERVVRGHTFENLAVREVYKSLNLSKEDVHVSEVLLDVVRKPKHALSQTLRYFDNHDVPDEYKSLYAELVENRPNLTQELDSDPKNNDTLAVRIASDESTHTRKVEITGAYEMKNYDLSKQRKDEQTAFVQTPISAVRQQLLEAQNSMRKTMETLNKFMPLILYAQGVHALEGQDYEVDIVPKERFRQILFQPADMGYSEPDQKRLGDVNFEYSSFTTKELQFIYKKITNEVFARVGIKE
ncbi:hypothetical protein KAZ57_01550 [Patescibacteria group bacterium]|nr:hypothetical protein [Patescibacteria group bacterium]